MSKQHTQEWRSKQMSNSYEWICDNYINYNHNQENVGDSEDRALTTGQIASNEFLSGLRSLAFFGDQQRDGRQDDAQGRLSRRADGRVSASPQ